MAKKATEGFGVQIAPLDIRTVPVKIVGDTPLIVHAWSEKSERSF